MANWWEKDPDEESPFRYRNLPVFKKGMEMLQTIYTMYDLIKDEDEDMHAMLKDQVRIILEDAQIVLAKIAGAEGADLYGLKIENAYIIKNHARNIQVSTNMLDEGELIDDEYIKLLRDQTDEFRKAFLAWVEGFDPTEDIKGEWDFH